MNLCDYGCGQEAKHQFKNGKWCCSDNISKCQIIRDIIRIKTEGKIVSKETRIKQSEARKGKISYLKGKSYEELYGKNKADELKKLCRDCNLGKVMTKLHRFKISKTLKKNGWCGYWKGRKNPERSKRMKGTYGKETPNWQGGITAEPYCDVWLDKDYKQSIKERDENRCLNPYCFKTSKNLVIHHIDYNKKNCHPNNLITICNSCNLRANKDREWHTSWYRAIMYRRYKIV